jgi:hypothetical protein
MAERGLVATLTLHSEMLGANAAVDVDPGETEDTPGPARILGRELRNDAGWRSDDADLAKFCSRSATVVIRIDTRDGRQLPQVSRLAAVHSEATCGWSEFSDERVDVLTDESASEIFRDFLLRGGAPRQQASCCGDDIRRRPLAERKAELKWILRRSRGGVQYVEHTEGDGADMFAAVCKLGLEGIVSKRLEAPYRSGPARSWLKTKNPKAPAATRAIDGTF